MNTCRIIKQSLGLRLVKLNEKWILYLPSDKDNAMKEIDEIASRINNMLQKRSDHLTGIDEFIEDTLYGKIKGFYLDLAYKQLLPYLK